MWIQGRRHVKGTRAQIGPAIIFLDRMEALNRGISRSCAVHGRRPKEVAGSDTVGGMMTDDNGWWYVCSINDEISGTDAHRLHRSKHLLRKRMRRGETLYGGIAVVAFD